LAMLQKLAINTLEGVGWLALILGTLVALSQMAGGTVLSAISAVTSILVGVGVWALFIVVALLARRSLR
jgi:hypothetical protein